jgi:DnaJ-class molecular chaperone
MQMVNMGFMQMQMQVGCDACGQRGQINSAKCPHCHGRKVVNDAKKLDISIEKGMKDGETIVFEREGEQVPGMIQGDVVFTIRQQANNRFRRINDNLFIDVTISL